MTTQIQLATMDSLTFDRSTKSMLTTPLHSGSLFSPSINFDTSGYTSTFGRIQLKNELEEVRKSIIEYTYHHTINCVLHRANCKPTPHCRSKCSQHHTSKSTCHQISEAHPESRHYSWVEIMAPAPTHMHPTDMRPLITKYKHHASHADYGAPFELVHSVECGPFSTPTSAGHCYYILFIDHYTCYAILWVLPDKQLKACTSAYHTDIRGKEKDLSYILVLLPSHFHHHTSKHIHYHTPPRNTHTTEPTTTFTCHRMHKEHIHYQTSIPRTFWAYNQDTTSLSNCESNTQSTRCWSITYKSAAYDYLNAMLSNIRNGSAPLFSPTFDSPHQLPN